MTAVPYVYAATVLRVIDGDTLALDVDLGFHTRSVMSCRVAGINCNELSEPLGHEAKALVQQLLPAGARVVVDSVRADKYAGRFDGRVTLPDGSDLATQLIDAGLAVVWDGTGPRPLVPVPAA